jgi:hypothetical protein
MGLSENEEWNIKTTIEFGLERKNILLQLRYQLAFGVIVLIAAVWTILIPVAQEKENFNFIYFMGWLISIILITGWRIFTHFIFLEELGWSVTHLYCLNKLDLLTGENTQLVGFENNLKLKEITNYKLLDTTEKKLLVIRKLQSHIPEKGISLFDYLSLCFIIGSWICLILLKIMNFDLIPIFILIGCTILLLGLILWEQPLCYWSEKAINKVISEMKTEISSQ